MPLRRLLSRVFVALTLALTLAGTLAGTPAKANTLTPGEMRREAAQALGARHPAKALALADALLSRDPKDVDALLLRARASRDLGRNALALDSARAAWLQADTERRKYAAALVMAQALASNERRSMAQFWLRRAAQLAPSDVQRAATIRDFNYVRQRNPLSVQLNFAVAPSSNINNGSTKDSTQILLGAIPIEVPITGAARALSGTEAAGTIAASYRLRETRHSQTNLLVDLGHRAYRLSPSARAAAPGVTGADFAFSELTAGIEHWMTPEGHNAPVRLKLGLGRNWYGGAPYMNHLSAEAVKMMPVSSRHMLSLGVSANVNEVIGTAVSARQLGLSLGSAQRLATGSKLSLGLGATFSDSNVPARDFTEIFLQGRLALAKPIAGVSLEIGADMRHRTHAVSRYSATGLDKTTLGADLTLLFPKFDYYGFMPTMTLRATATESNVGLFETRALGLGFGVRSAF